MAKHVIALVPQPKGNGGDHWTSPNGVELVMHSNYVRREVNFTIGVVGPDGEGRKEMGGPLVKGVWGYLVSQPSVLAAHRLRRPVLIRVEDGDTLEVWCIDPACEGADMLVHKLELVIRDDRRMGYPRLVAVEAPAEAAAA